MSTSLETEFRRRLRLIMQQFGSVADLAKAVGVSDNAIYKWVSGRGQPGMTSLVSLARAAGVSVEWLATGQGTTKGNSGSPAFLESSSLCTTTTVVYTPAGSLDISQSTQIVDFLHFKSAWFQRQFGLDPSHVALIETRGDSMAPTIADGDLCLINLTESRFSHDRIYVLSRGNELLVKRLQREPADTLLILCDNPAYPTIRISSDEVAILGPVIWLGRKP